MRPAVTVTVDRAQALMRNVRALMKYEVLVGIPDGTKGHKLDGKPVANSFPLSAIGLINELGSPAQNIPARPMLIPGVMSVRGAISEAMADAAKEALINEALQSSSAPGRPKVFVKIGSLAANAVQNRITAVLSPALKPATLRARKAKGFRGESPLIVTGQFLNAITFVVLKRGADNGTS